MADEHEEWTPYQKMEAGILKDISHDTDTILDKMEDMNMGESFDMGMLAGLVGNKGIDPGIVALLNDRCKDGMWGDGGMLTLLFLIILLGGGRGFGYGADGAGVAGVDRTVVNEANYTRLLDAVGGQGARQEAAVQSLAATLNCDVQAINAALYGVDKQLAVNHGDIINAIQSCCCNVRTEILQSQNALQSQIAKCCCDTNLNVERQACDIKNQIQETRFLVQTTDAATRQLIQECCCDLKSEMKDGFNAIQLREDQREIQSLRDKIQEQREAAQTALLLNAYNGTKTASGTLNTTAGTWTGSVTPS